MHQIILDLSGLLQSSTTFYVGSQILVAHFNWFNYQNESGCNCNDEGHCLQMILLTNEWNKLSWWTLNLKNHNEKQLQFKDTLFPHCLNIVWRNLSETIATLNFTSEKLTKLAAVVLNNGLERALIYLSIVEVAGFNNEDWWEVFQDHEESEADLCWSGDNLSCSTE